MADWSLADESVWRCHVHILQRPEIIEGGEGAADNVRELNSP
jgi:hypothetical protein